MLRHDFTSMGSAVELYLESTDEDASPLLAAETEFHRLESTLSRFDVDSELSELNRQGTMRVGPELLELAQISLDARATSDGRFDPTVHDALVGSGYDRTFELVTASHTAPATPAPCMGGVTIDVDESTVALEPGFHLDLGGIAKGWAADRVLAELTRHGPALVNAGGDIASAGRPWPIGVDTPDGGLTLELGDGALATSGRDRRVWRQGAAVRHHLIDPATGQPSKGDLLRVSSVARTAAEAEVLAKSLFLRGKAAAAAAEANERCIPSVLVTLDGRTVLAGGLA